jgi:hypothetical protein
MPKYDMLLHLGHIIIQKHPKVLSTEDLKSYGNG